MITLTEKAVKQLKEISEAEGIGHFSIRLKVQGGGCAGFTNDMFFDDKPSELDEVVEQDGVQVIIDPLSYSYLEETEIDYVDSPIGSGFKFNNPNVKGSCGCGHSSSY